MTIPYYPFTTDGCSGPSSLFGFTPPWLGCCKDHDSIYWMGGTREQRKAADKALRLCVVKRGYPFIAGLMWAAVRIGGHPLLPFPWRWGYGYRKRGYR